LLFNLIQLNPNFLLHLILRRLIVLYERISQLLCSNKPLIVHTNPNIKRFTRQYFILTKIDIKRLLCRLQGIKLRVYLTENHYSSTPLGSVDHHQLTLVSVQVDLPTPVRNPYFLQNTR